MKDIEAILSSGYGLSIESVREAPRGFVAETYIVNTDNKKYFLKILKDNRYSTNIIQSLPILDELKTLGVDYINYPIRTKDNKLCFKRDDRILILFNYIHGRNSRDYVVEEVYKKLIKIHKLTNELNSVVNREDSLIKYSKAFESSLEKYKQLEVIEKHIDDIKKHWGIFKGLSRKLSKSEFEMYLTHGDAFGNIIKDNDSLYIIDWDDLILAPLERDLWFFKDNKRVVELYKGAFKDFKINQELLEYYIYNRFFDDLLGFFELLDLDPNEDDRKGIVKDIEKDCINWTYKLIKDF